MSVISPAACLSTLGVRERGSFSIGSKSSCIPYRVPCRAQASMSPVPAYAVILLALCQEGDRV